MVVSILFGALTAVTGFACSDSHAVKRSLSQFLIKDAATEKLYHRTIVIQQD